MKRLGVVMAWRKGETEVAATVESAERAAGKAAKIITVEDKTGAGPARTRHRGIVAADDCDIVAVVDAHMRFDGAVLRDMAARVRANGGLLCAKCYHNPECSFDGKHPGDNVPYYAGAEIHYRARIHCSPANPQGEQHSLEWKWSDDRKPGPRGCIGGACYVFPRAWYLDVGAPWEALPGWGCDEELLSIAAWLSGHMPEVYDGKVAHRWRNRVPWRKTGDEVGAQWTSHMSLIHAVVADPVERAELEHWQMDWLRESPVKAKIRATPEAERVRVALLKQPRTWAQWRRDVCKCDIDDAAAMTAKPKPTRAAPVSRANYGATENLRLCPACGSDKSNVTHTRQVGALTFRYRLCECGRRRVTRQGA
jgi:hypothetical protein